MSDLASSPVEQRGILRRSEVRNGIGDGERAGESPAEEKKSWERSERLGGEADVNIGIVFVEDYKERGTGKRKKKKIMDIETHR